MADDIYTGVDCCEDSVQKGRTVHVYPSIIRAQPGQKITFQARNVTRECDPGCFYWRILAGGGRLAEEFGFAVPYYVAQTQDFCSANAQIGLFCQGDLIDVARVAVNQYTGDDIAYWQASKWRDGFFPQENKCLTYIPPAETYGSHSPKRSCLTVTAKTCDGRSIDRVLLGLRQQAAPGIDGKPALIPNRWIGISPDSLSIIAIGSRDYSFEAAKAELEDGFGVVHFRVTVPTQYTIPPRLPENPTLEQQQAYDAAYKLWKAWVDFVRHLRDAQLRAGGVVDVRNPFLQKENCCPPEVD